MSQNNQCCLCKTPMPNDAPLRNPFFFKQEEARRYPRRYAHTCDTCAAKCDLGEVTEEQFNKAAWPH